MPFLWRVIYMSYPCSHIVLASFQLIWHVTQSMSDCWMTDLSTSDTSDHPASSSLSRVSRYFSVLISQFILLSPPKSFETHSSDLSFMKLLWFTCHLTIQSQLLDVPVIVFGSFWFIFNLNAYFFPLTDLICTVHERRNHVFIIDEWS